MATDSEPVGHQRPRPRGSPAPELLLALERGAGGPLHEQLERGLRELVRS